MDFITNFPLFTIVHNLFSGVLCMMLSGKNARRYTIIYECLLIVMVSCVLWYTWTTNSAFTYVMGEFPAPWGNEIRAGVLEAAIALLYGSSSIKERNSSLRCFFDFGLSL